MRIQDIFTKFLKDEGVINEYCRCWDPIFAEKPIKTGNLYLVHAFDWGSSETDWKGLDQKWRTIYAKYKKRSLPKLVGKRKGNYRKCKLCGKFMTCSEIYFDRKLCHKCMGYARGKI